MIPDISQELAWQESHPWTLIGIRRGLERETLRINKDGSLAKTGHPISLGSALTHKWITTDFAEALLEFITPVDSEIDRMLMLMRDIHRFTTRQLMDEQIWPLSMPCYGEKEQEIKLAQYGKSNLGRLKTLYREGLKNRYGSLMQTISGVHYNFSLSMIFWKERYGSIDKEVVSAGYFRLIRNYYRYGWIIPYLFGASPAICSSFLGNRTISLPFKKSDHDMYYLPHATSLRLSDLGYANKLQNNLKITFNKLHDYIALLKKAIKTPSKEYEKIGLEKKGKRLQINSNLLQIEDELYAPIRPKHATKSDEAPLDALERGGIEYIEVRSLDINPFSPIGVAEQQIRFLDLFMVWCVLADAPKMSFDELRYVYVNWNRVILEGRKPGLMLSIGCNTKKIPLKRIGKNLFYDLKRLAYILDDVCGSNAYQQVCDELIGYFDYPDLTFSARILQSMIEKGIRNTGCILSDQYRNILLQEPLEVLSESDFIVERDASLKRQKEIEEADSESFDVFLEKHN